MLFDPKPHLIVPWAQCSGDDWLRTVSPLVLKNFSQLLRGMKQVDTDQTLADSLSPPHERVLAKALGLSASADGLIPWAAHEAQAAPGQAWAFITPCHWAMGREHAVLTDPATLNLPEDQSRALLAAMQPYFVTEGIVLHYATPTRWLAQGDIFRGLPTASLDRVLGRNLDKWLPGAERSPPPQAMQAISAPLGGSALPDVTGGQARRIRRLQNEMQMLLYTHPINDDRSTKGQRSVNSLWVSGSGALNEIAITKPQLVLTRALAHAAFSDDWAAYSTAWTQLDAADIAPLLAQQNSGKTVRISLCGETKAITFETTQHGILTQIKNTFKPWPPMNVLKQL